MKLVSTRGKAEEVHFSKAIQNSLALDGGLYIPKVFPRFDPVSHPDEFPNWKGTSGLVEVAHKLLKPWLDNDSLLWYLEEICRDSFNFEAPLSFVEPETALLELYHGPTAAFKDFGARFLAGCLRHIQPKQSKLVLVATSGDTGGAVAAAFHNRSDYFNSTANSKANSKADLKVMILFPEGKVSAIQEKQLTTWGDNVRAFAVQGNFDDCQMLVKKAFAYQGQKRKTSVFSANSISIGRLLPQAVYYATSSLEYFHRTGHPPGLIVPTGNLGNGVAALWAKRMGFPIREVVLATNANSSISKFLKTGFWEPMPSLSTVANAMDVGNPSNIERLVSLYPSIKEMRQEVSAISVLDSDIAMEVTWAEKEWNRVVCPHTATAVHARRGQKKSHWILAATAHPAKFEPILRSWVSREIEMPDSLSKILSRKSEFTRMVPDWKEMHTAISDLLGSEL